MIGTDRVLEGIMVKVNKDTKQGMVKVLKCLILTG